MFIGCQQFDTIYTAIFCFFSPAHAVLIAQMRNENMNGTMALLYALLTLQFWALRKLSLQSIADRAAIQKYAAFMAENCALKEATLSTSCCRSPPKPSGKIAPHS